MAYFHAYIKYDRRCYPYYRKPRKSSLSNRFLPLNAPRPSTDPTLPQLNFRSTTSWRSTIRIESDDNIEVISVKYLTPRRYMAVVPLFLAVIGDIIDVGGQRAALRSDGVRIVVAEPHRGVVGAADPGADLRTGAYVAGARETFEVVALLLDQRDGRSFVRLASYAADLLALGCDGRVSGCLEMNAGFYFSALLYLASSLAHTGGLRILHKRR